VDELTFGNTALDLATSTLVCGDRQIRLSAKEFDIMRYLFQSGEKNLSKEVILARVWGYDSEAVENHVEVYVGFLRKKLRSIGSNVQIQAVRKLGYHLEVKDCDYLVMPEMFSHDITDALMEENYYPIFSIAQGLTTDESTSSAVTALLTTSDTSYSKTAGYDLTTYEKEEGDTDGPFVLGVSIDTGNDGRIVWFSSSDFLTDVCNAYSSGANMDLTMNALADLIGEREAIAIRSKSLDYNYLTISESVASLLKTVMIGVFPLVYLGVGIVVIVSRKQVQHETV